MKTFTQAAPHIQKSDPIISSKQGIRNRVLRLTLTPIIAISLLLTILFSFAQVQDIEGRLREFGFAIGLQLALETEIPLAINDLDSINKTLLSYLENKEVSGIALYRPDGSLVARVGHSFELPNEVYSVVDRSHGITLVDADQWLWFTVPVKSRNEETIGWILLEVSHAQAALKEYQVGLIGFGMILIGIIMSAITAWRIGRDVTDPILEMAHAVNKIKAGKLNVTLKTQAKGELLHLEEGINAMAKALSSSHGEMQNSIDTATKDLRRTLETIEIQNIELELAKKEAETASHIKSEFLANISHEIRTPLNGVIGFLQLLMKTRLDEHQKDYLSIIHRSANHLLSIMNDILDFSKIEAGKLILERSPCNIRDILEDAITLMAPMAQEKNIELIASMKPDIPVHILGDAVRLKQILTNLIANAIKYTDTGFVVVTIGCQKALGDHYVFEARVKDTGIGLSILEQRKLFQAFQQVETLSNKRLGGTGLGLVICKRLTQYMGGDIGVESTKGHGATFWFTFLTQLSTPFEEPTPRFDTVHCLLIEENAAALDAIQQSCQCIGVKNQTIALQDFSPALYQNQYSAVLLGLSKTNSSSSILLPIFQEKPRNLPIFVAINTNNPYEFEKFYNLGAQLVVPKPLSLEKIITLFQQNHTKDTKSISYPPVRSDKKILAVDDYWPNLKLLKAQLGSIDSTLTIDTAIDGKTALARISQENYDLIFLDLSMPDIDGFAVAKIIREMNSPSANIPIIAITAHAHGVDLEGTAATGKALLDGILIKPVTLDALQSILNRFEIRTPKATDPLLAQFLEGLPEELAQMEALFRAEDFAKLREVVHRVHGALCYCNLPPLKMVVRSLEIAILEGAHYEIERLLFDFLLRAKVLLEESEGGGVI